MHKRIRSLVAVLITTVVLVVSMQTVRVAGAQTDQSEANKTTASIFLEAMYDPSRFAEVDPNVAEDFTIPFPTGAMDWDTVKANVDSFHDAMPDVAITPLIMLAEGNYVALRYKFSSTFISPLTNFDGTVLPPTGQPVFGTANAILTFTDDGMIVEYREVFDTLSFMAQLGAFPMPEPAMTAPTEPADPTVWTIQPMSADFTEALKESLDAAMLAAYSQGDADALDAVYAPGFISYPTMADLATYKIQIAGLRAAVPDLQVATAAVVAEGNWIAYHWTVSGTFTGEMDYGGTMLAPTNQPISFEGIVLAYANEDGLIVADWSEVDNLSVGMQFGMIPAQ